MRWILGWGDAAEVLEPEDLRRKMVQVLDQTLANYGASIKSSPDVLA